MFFDKKPQPNTIEEEFKEVTEEEIAEHIIPIPHKSAEDETNAPIVRVDEADNVNFGDVLGKLAAGSEEATAIAGIMELTHSDGETQDANLAMKSVVTHSGAFTAGQWMANYNDDLGMPQVADALRMICKWQYTHNSAYKGERAKQAFNALNEQQQKEFLLQKEAKGLIH